jgi:hypothetical protein
MTVSGERKCGSLQRPISSTYEVLTQYPDPALPSMMELLRPLHRPNTTTPLGLRLWVLGDSKHLDMRETLVVGQYSWATIGEIKSAYGMDPSREGPSMLVRLMTTNLTVTFFPNFFSMLFWEPQGQIRWHLTSSWAIFFWRRGRGGGGGGIRPPATSFPVQPISPGWVQTSHYRHQVTYTTHPIPQLQFVP